MAFAAFVALLALASVVSATPAAAKTTPCGKQVVTDWFRHIHTDGKVHGRYPLHCYSDALGSLDPSVDTYTNARTAISAALAAETLRQGGSGPSNPARPSSSKLQRGEKPIARHNTYDFPGAYVQPIDPTPVGSSSPSSVPLPLIVLAALAAVLLLAGAGSYVVRRLKANRAAPPATDTTT